MSLAQLKLLHGAAWRREARRAWLELQVVTAGTNASYGGKGHKDLGAWLKRQSEA